MGTSKGSKLLVKKLPSFQAPESSTGGSVRAKPAVADEGVIGIIGRLYNTSLQITTCSQSSGLGAFVNVNFTTPVASKLTVFTSLETSISRVFILRAEI